MNRIVRHILLLPVLLLLFAACSQETDIPGGGKETPGSDLLQVELFTRAYNFSTPTTRASSADETGVGQTPWVLVFEGNNDNATFVEAAKAYYVDGVGKTYVDLTARATPCRLLLLANPKTAFYLKESGSYLSHSIASEENDFNTVLSGKSLTVVCNMLFTAPLDAPQTEVPFLNEVLPMSNLLTVSGINAETKLEGGLQRAVAKLIVENTDANFVLDGVSAVLNVSQRGLLHNLYNTPPDGVEQVNYEGSTAIIAAASNDGVTQNTESNPIYLYETGTGNEACLIIKGTYASVTYYYKMKILDSSGNAMAILRNREYAFTIKSVAGPGYYTLSDALVSDPLNEKLDFEIKVVNTSAFEVKADNDYYLAVSNSLFIAYYNPDPLENAFASVHFTAFELVTDCDISFPVKRTITRANQYDWSNPNFYFYYNWSHWEESITIPTNNSEVFPVEVMLPTWLGIKSDEYMLIELGNLVKRVYLRREGAISAEGSEISIIPYEWEGDSDYTSFNSGEVVDEFNTGATNWIRLRTKNKAGELIKDRTDTANLTVDNGIIIIDVAKNEGAERRGTVYLTTTGGWYDDLWTDGVRIKVVITQMGVS